LGTFGTNPKFGDLGTNHTLNLGTKPIKSLETFLVDFEQSLFKNTFPEFEKKEGSCVIFRNKNNLTTKLRIFETKS
jgi:hypothetical protein